MQVVFRADASVDIGTGHVMRCLTLADALREGGAHCVFICRDHSGNLAGHIRARGYATAVLGTVDGAPPARPGQPAHAAWLGAAPADDAAECIAFLRTLDRPDWLVVDHYALDAEWESAVRPLVGRLMVIDDLADRPHDCDLLLDQTFGRDPASYAGLVPSHAQVLCGAKYAMLRPEFASLRGYSVERRRAPALRELLISLGGVDKPNATLLVLEALAGSALRPETNIKVVMGATAPWLEQVRHYAAGMAFPVEVLVGVSDMARLMAEADFAIGAAGATAWERCSLGLPTAMVVLAENQRFAAGHLAAAGAALMLDRQDDFAGNLQHIVARLLSNPHELQRISQCALGITEGTGCLLVQAVLHS